MTSTLITALRRSARTHAPHVRAAIELLIEHDSWLRRTTFTDACVRHEPGSQNAWISWTAASDLYDNGDFRASTTELAVLDLAIALGSDRFHFSAMGRTNAATIRRAVDTALTH